VAVKLCIIGVRGHYGYVLDGLAAVPHVRVAGLSAGARGDDIGPLKEWCDRHGHEARVFDEYRAMLDALRPDVVVVAGPFEQHAAMSIEAFRRGAHVFCEKPVAMTPEALAELRAEHARAGVHFAAMMGLRYPPGFHGAWRAVRQGEIGEVRLLQAQKSYKLGERPGHFRRRETFGGTIPWVGSHAIDWIHWFAGSVFRSVYATHTTRANRGHGELEATALCHFTLAGDVFASAAIDYLRPDRAPTHGDDRIRVAGTEGVVEVREGGASLLNGKADGVQRPDAPYSRQIFEDFVAAVEGTGKPLIGPEDTFAVTEACLLARQSADEGRVVPFPAAQENAT